MYKRILVPTDGSELSRKAVDSALALAAQLKAEVVALKVVPHYPQSYFEGSAPIDLNAVGQTELQWLEAAKKVVQAVQASGEAVGVRVRPETAMSDLVSETVLSTAAKLECDLIVMASHGRNGLKRLLLGSETQQVLTHSKIPVLVLR
ncbi:MAG: universal stress protein UspA [Rhodoferax sp.]|nr:universal stress protein UspA [Rhodoferax sp.]